MNAVCVLGLAALLAAALVTEARIMGEVSVQEKMRMDADLSEVSPRAGLGRQLPIPDRRRAARVRGCPLAGRAAGDRLGRGPALRHFILGVGPFLY